MKLPPLPIFTGKKKHTQELFLSLLLYPDAVEASMWELSKTRQPIVIGAVTQEIVEDTWEARKHAADTCITTLENLSKNSKIEKVVLGFPAPYLTHDGDIIKDIRSNVKSLTQALGLTPIGFVSVYQAIVHKYKKDEGVPVSIILLGITEGSITMSLYRVGVFVGQVVIPKQGSVAEHLEDALLQFSQNTVLPSRILLYGTKRNQLESIKRDVLKHQWTTRMNFIHFPKVEILPGDGAAIAVSYAGAAELTQSVAIEEDSIQEEDPIEEIHQEVHTASVSELKKEFEAQEQEEDEEEKDLNNDGEEGEEDEEDEEEGEEINEEEANTLAEDEEEAEFEEAEELNEHEEINYHEHANIVAVDPQALGFTAGDEDDETQEKHVAARVPKKHGRRGNPLAGLVVLSQRLALTIKGFVSHKSRRGFKPIYAIVLAILVFVLFGGFYLFDTVLPKATVTIAVVPKSVSLSQPFVVDPSIAEITEAAIPGKKREQTETGEKAVPATGKKTIGDSAIGEITVYNKSLISRTFKKGTVVSAGSVDFTLDTDVSVASASETLDTKTYGKANVKVTAKAIGDSGNIGAGKTLGISGISSDLANARNDKAFTGGSSRDVTVVSRADQDAIVKDLTADLIAKAKENFESSGSEILIPETIKTSVTKREFSKEIGEEAIEVNGTITVTITGTGYASSDVTHLLRDKIQAQVEDGYELSSELPQIETKPPTIEKDGTIKLAASITSTITPRIDSAELVKTLVGVPKSKALETITVFKGVGGVDIVISSLFSKNRMPKRSQAITILVKNAQ